MHFDIDSVFCYNNTWQVLLVMMRVFLKNKFNILILFLFAVIAVAGILHHEIWRDEGQVWLVVRDLNLYGVFDHVRNEGHPLLWYLLVMPFAKLKLSVISMQFLSFAFMTAAAGVFLWFSPFSKVSKVCVIFSAGFLYWLTIISRNYSIIPLFLFLAAVFYSRQKEHPYWYCVFNILLSNTHILMFGFCSAIAMLFGYENIFKNPENRKKYIAPFIITLVCLAVTALYILTRPEENESASVAPLSTINLADVWSSISGFFVNIYAEYSLNAIIGGICILAAMLWLFVRDKKLGFVFCFSSFYQFYIYVCVWKSSPEKAMLVLLSLVFCLWCVLISRTFTTREKVFVNLLVILIFGLTLRLGYQLYRYDILYKYSGSKEAAGFIQNNIEKDAVIISNITLTTAGLLAYLPDRQFYVTVFNDYYTFGYKKFSMKKERNFDGRKIYYIYSAMAKPDKNKEILFVSASDTLIPTEVFYIARDK